ncbi:hypothetical protein PYJP_15610 [Pyrofollis japonicus]|nr:hypothetical protein PYJP_15610 [Pyrofollis japonicus]
MKLNNFFKSKYCKRNLRAQISQDIVVFISFSITVLAFLAIFISFINGYLHNKQEDSVYTVRIHDVKGYMYKDKIYKISFNINNSTIDKIEIRIRTTNSTINAYCDTKSLLQVSDSIYACISLENLGSYSFKFNENTYSVIVYEDSNRILHVLYMLNNSYFDSYSSFKTCGATFTNSIMCMIKRIILYNDFKSFILASSFRKPVIAIEANNNNYVVYVVFRYIDLSDIKSIEVALFTKMSKKPIIYNFGVKELRFVHGES